MFGTVKSGLYGDPSGVPGHLSLVPFFSQVTLLFASRHVPASTVRLVDGNL